MADGGSEVLEDSADGGSEVLEEDRWTLSIPDVMNAVDIWEIDN